MSDEQRQHHLNLIRQRLDDELPHERNKRLTAARDRSRKVRQNKPGEQTTQLLENMRKNYKRRNCINEDIFMSPINEFDDMLCVENCYTQSSIVNLKRPPRADLLSNDLVKLSNVMVLSLIHI